MDFSRKLPVGIQDFGHIRRDGYVYVDKTEYIYRLVHLGIPYFLSRPRRFGKSLLLSTLRAYWEGEKELFKGLRIEELEADNPDAWQAYPVFYFDFNRDNFSRESALEEVLEKHLIEWETEYATDPGGFSLAARFQNLIVTAKQKTGRDCVVLVDEYDKPLLEAADQKMTEHNQTVFKGFFSTLKSYDGYLKFVFLTGVTKFSKVSIFNDLNHLNDISLDVDYGTICGITEGELKSCFEPEINRLAKASGTSAEECLFRLKKMYDGYHFSHSSEGVYNPFSLLSAFSKRELGMYWFATGTPTFLIKKLKESGFDVKQITEGYLYATENILTDYRYDSSNPVPLFYQTGYLTIKGYDKKYRSYQLDYPNDEVKYGFLESLAPSFLADEKDTDPLDIRSFGRDLDLGNTDSLRDRFTALFARLPYPTDERALEQNFQNVIYIVFMLLGQFTQTEIHSAKDRADCIVCTDDLIYIFEFKRDKSADEAFTQIEEKGYAKAFSADKRTVYKIGVNFDSQERNIVEWKCV